MVIQLVGLPDPDGEASTALGLFVIVVAIAGLGVLAFATDALDASVSSRVGMTVCPALIVASHITTMVSLGLQIHLLLSCLLCAVAVGCGRRRSIGRPRPMTPEECVGEPAAGQRMSPG